MLIMGVDPGIAHTGYAVLESQDQALRLHDLGIIETSKINPFPERLKKIGNSLEKIIAQYRPDEIAVEDIFIASGINLALKLGQARGVALYVACRSGAKIFEYTPLMVKKAIVGYGGAGKDQVRKMVRVLLNLKELKVHDDASDALAVAICHQHSSQLRHLLLKESDDCPSSRLTSE